MGSSEWTRTVTRFGRVTGCRGVGIDDSEVDDVVFDGAACDDTVFDDVVFDDTVFDDGMVCDCAVLGDADVTGMATASCASSSCLIPVRGAGARDPNTFSGRFFRRAWTQVIAGAGAVALWMDD
ncbi:hypothetical protein [Actinocrinis sp.]|uniref:hypothetical protein n=1 Tax=Actinocrinis sp. TaxID=1920516 RepID=UPI002DDCCDC7|nr:hypothetical protein [Actinocrinis sp.]